MNRLIRTWTSWEGFNKAKRPSGQIATIMILFLVIALIFTMVTANIGRVALDATGLSNAADASALQLGSNLASEANFLAESLRNTCGNPLQCCHGRGLLFPMLFNVFGDIILNPFARLFPSAFGKIRENSISTREALKYGIELIVGILGAGATAGLSVAAAVGLIYLQYKMTGEAFEEAARELNRLNKIDRIREDAIWTALIKSVDDPNLVKDVNDSNMNGDTEELVSKFQVDWFTRLHYLERFNSRQKNMVTFFLQYSLPRFRGSLKKFLEGGTYTTMGWGSLYTFVVPSVFKSQEYEFYTDPNSTTGEILIRAGTQDGDLVSLLRGLWNMGYPVKIDFEGGPVTVWEPGPTFTDYSTWLTSTCDTPSACPDPPAGYDYLDSVCINLWDFTRFMDMLLAEPDTAALAFDYWMPLLYDKSDPTNQATYYGQVLVFLQIMGAIRAKLKALRDSYPYCLYGYYEDPSHGYGPDGWPQVDPSIPCLVCGPPDLSSLPPGWLWGYWWCSDECYINSPCQIQGWYGENGLSLDADRRDEFTSAMQRIEEFIREVTYLKSSIETFFRQVELSGGYVGFVRGLQPCVPGELDCVIYTWDVDDGSGNIKWNSVRVKVGNFQLPAVVAVKYGNWLYGRICQELHHYTDEDNCWVEITKSSPPREMGDLGTWNPFAVRPLKKRAKVDFSYDHVRLKQW